MAIINKPEIQPSNQPAPEHSEFPRPLSERDSIRLIKMLENPPAPNEALKKLVAAARGRVRLEI